MTDPATLKNDTQRKTWLEHYQEWGLWYTDEHIEANYYRYQFQKGYVLVVDEYPRDHFTGPYCDKFYHLFGGPEYCGYHWNWHEKYDRRADSITAIVNFLKLTHGGTT